MKIITYKGGGVFNANCYIVISESGNAAVIDAPLGNEKLLEAVESNGGKLTKILLTHGHCDHIESLAFLTEKTGAEVYIHTLDEQKLHDDYLNLSEYFADYYERPIAHYENARTVESGDVITLDELEFRVLHTPGHTGGSVCYILNGIMFSGDTIFNMSIGRTDMPDGNPVIMQQTLALLSSIEDVDFTILSGHGDPTRLSLEKLNNPFMRGFDYDDMF